MTYVNVLLVKEETRDLMISALDSWSSGPGSSPACVLGEGALNLMLVANAAMEGEYKYF